MSRNIFLYVIYICIAIFTYIMYVIHTTPAAQTGTGSAITRQAPVGPSESHTPSSGFISRLITREKLYI